MGEQITIKSVKRYTNCMSRLIRLNYVERYLLDWLTEQMDKEAVVLVGKIQREEFIKFMNKISGGEEEFNYSDGTIKNAIQALKKYDFLVPTGEYTKMWINPKYYYIDINPKRKYLIPYINRKIDERNN